MKINGMVWVAGSAATVALTSCKMPPQQAWRQIQSEGLASYMGAEPKQRAVAGGEGGSREKGLLSTFDWLEGTRDAAEAPLSNAPERRRLSGEVALRTAAPVPGRPGIVYSPHAAGKFVNVGRYAAGDEVRCPHTGRAFLVPDFNSASVEIAARGEGRERLRFDAAGAESDADLGGRSAPEPPAPDPAPLASKPDGLTAKRVPGQPNHVFSPYAPANQVVDVTGLNPGERARCPFSNRVFVVPPAAAPQPADATKPDGGQTRTEAQKEGAREVADMAEKLDFRVIEDRAEQEAGAAEKPAPEEPDPMPELAPGPEPDPTADAGTPTASWSAKPGYVASPYGGHLVDVRGKASGATVRCPFSGKLFKVPAGSN